MPGAISRSWVGIVIAASMSVGLVGCGMECEQGGLSVTCQPTQPGSLAAVKVPLGATLPTTRGVNVKVAVKESVLPASGIAPVVVKTMNGRVLFEGPVRAGQPLGARVVVPRATDRLVAFLHAGGEPLRAEATITDGNVAVSFE